MYIQLMHRSYGIHSPIKHTEIPCDFETIYLGDDHINEDLLLEHIPEGWLPTKPDMILLTVGNEFGSTGQCNLEKFKPWAKYFDAYVLELHKEPMKWWEELTTGEDDE